MYKRQVYISGESGTGKELAARQIHHLSSRSDNPFVPVNCGAIPAELMESEFFRHTKGSFTGAIKDKEGLFQAVHILLMVNTLSLIHISEPTRLLSISYAVFCLKKFF